MWRGATRHIRTFERMLVDEGTAIVKLFLTRVAEEQRERLQDRIDSPDERWKFRCGDLDDRKLWPDYMQAYRDALARTSMPGRTVVRRPRRPQVGAQPDGGPDPRHTLERLDPQYPKPEPGIEGLVVNLAVGSAAVCTVRQVSVVIPTTLAEAVAVLADDPTPSSLPAVPT